MSARQLSNVAPDLAVLDGAAVFVLIDNVSDGLSSVPDGVTNGLPLCANASINEARGIAWQRIEFLPHPGNKH